MPVTAAQLTPSILSQLNARGIVGPFAVNLSTGVSQGIQGFVKTLVVRGRATGSVGAGVGTGKWLLEPVTGSALLTYELQGEDLNGVNHSLLAQGVAFGTALVVNTSAIVQTGVTGVAVGTEIGTIANANATVATGLIYAGLTSAGIVGLRATSLASALGKGLASWFKKGKITSAVVGTPVTPPAVGQGRGIGKII